MTYESYLFSKVQIKNDVHVYPIGSMYGIFTYMYHKKTTKIHVGKYTSSMDPTGTPLKINMEHNHLGLVQIIFPFFSWVMAVGEPAVNLPGCNLPWPNQTKNPSF